MAIKQIAGLFTIMLSLFFLFSACGSNHSPVTIEMELTSNYDDSDPFVIEQLFYVSEDAERVDFEAFLQMRSETCLLEIADNETKEV